MATTRRTHVCRIQNHSQVVDALDLHGWSASKLWNVGRYYIQQRWDDDGEIPNEDELKNELKTHSKYNGLHSQSSQNVLEGFLKPSVRGTAPTTTETIHRATAKKTTTTTTATASTKYTRVQR